ncbi:phage holin family protein [Tabrizicola sp. BL-A-41-H6]|uniref:phage holin family protein n=1 Tax=Tabrizicola sp. BL-A-41-H6 TaxID=3421107 RepID=UPI003D6762E3
MNPQDTSRTAAEMMVDVAGNISNLVRDEVNLAKAEVVASVKGAVSAIAMMMVALVLAITGVNVLSAAVVAAFIAAGLSPVWATVVTGVLFLVVAGLIVIAGISAMKRIGFVPRRVATNIQRDVKAATEAYNDK